ncbi:hypothetical protein ACU686_16920 [Yinghuangia aomiensis]
MARLIGAAKSAAPTRSSSSRPPIGRSAASPRPATRLIRTVVDAWLGKYRRGLGGRRTRPHGLPRRPSTNSAPGDRRNRGRGGGLTGCTSGGWDVSPVAD